MISRARRMPLRIGATGADSNQASARGGVLALGARGRTAPLCLVKDHLANADLVRSHLDTFVVVCELERLFQGEATRRRLALQLFARRGANVVELLLLGDVEVHVF